MKLSLLCYMYHQYCIVLLYLVSVRFSLFKDIFMTTVNSVIIDIIKTKNILNLFLST